MGINLNKEPLAVEHRNYLTKFINICIVYDLATWPRNPTNNFKFKNCLFGVTNIVKNSDNEMYVYSGYRITFNSVGSWNFNNYFARIIISLSINNSLSCHSDNRKNNFLILGESRTYGINESFGSLEKKFSINFTKANTKFCFSLDYNADNIYFFVNGNEIFRFKHGN